MEHVNPARRMRRPAPDANPGAPDREGDEARALSGLAGPSRRGFLAVLWGGLIGLASFELVWIVLSFLKPRARGGAAAHGAALVVAGPAESFEPGSVTAFPQGRFYLVRLDDGGFLALHRECTHLGCSVPWIEDERRFVCPCHASSFDITGTVLAPPAPRPLDMFRIRLENGIVKVEVEHPVRRSSFQPVQASYL